MNNLADVVLEYYWFLNFCSEDDVDPDLAERAMESLVYTIETAFMNAEKAALQDAAKRALAQRLRAPDEHGYSPRKLLTMEQRTFLESIAAGRFSGLLLDGEEG